MLKYSIWNVHWESGFILYENACNYFPLPNFAMVFGIDMAQHSIRIFHINSSWHHHNEWKREWGRRDEVKSQYKCETRNALGQVHFCPRHQQIVVANHFTIFECTHELRSTSLNGSYIYVCNVRAQCMRMSEWVRWLSWSYQLLFVYTHFFVFFFGFVYLFSSGVACLICAFRQQNTFRIYTTIMSELMLLRWRQPKIHIWIYFLISMMNLITMLRWIEMMHSTQLQRKDSINTIK